MTDPKIISAEDTAHTVAGIASTLCLDEEVWGWFNVKRKRRGSFFNRFVEPTVLAQENFLKQEIAVAALSRTLSTLHLMLKDAIQTGIIAARALEILVDGQERQGTVWKAFGFSSREFALKYLFEGVVLYMNGRSYPGLFAQRMVSVTTEESKRLWLAGSVLLFVKPPFASIPFMLNELLSGRTVGGKVRVGDKAFRDFGFEIVKRLQAVEAATAVAKAARSASAGDDAKGE